MLTIPGLSCTIPARTFTISTRTFTIRKHIHLRYQNVHLRYQHVLYIYDTKIFKIRTTCFSFRAFPANYDNDLYKFHLEAMFKGLLVHLDDPSSHIQEGVLLSLKEACSISSSILNEQVALVQHKHRVSRYCDELLQHINTTQT